MLRGAFRHAGETGHPSVRQLAVKRGLAWTGIWGLLFLLYLLVMGQGARLVGLGILLGIVGALAITRVISGLLFEVSTLDPVAFVGAGLLMTIVALVAVWVPARRAIKVDPVEVLRAE